MKEDITSSIDEQSQVVLSLRRPQADRVRAMWQPGERIADYRRMFAFYLDVVENVDYALRKDARAHDRMMRDGQVYSAIRVRQLANASRKLAITPKGDSEEDKRYAELTRDMLRRIHRFPEMLLNVLDAIPRGMSCQEIEWQLSNQTMLFEPLKLYPVHPSRIKFDLDNHPVLVSPFDIFWGEKLPPNSFMLHTHDPEPGDWSKPEEEGRLVFGHGLLDRLYPWFLWKSICIRNWLRLSDRVATGTLVGRYPWKNAEARTQIMDILKMVQSHGAVAFPSDAGFEIDLLKGDNHSADFYKNLVGYIDDQMTKMVLGSTMLMDTGSVGSYAMAEVHERTTFGRLVTYDADSVVSTLRDQLVRYIFVMNDWPVAAMPEIEFQSQSRWSLTEIVNACVKLSDMGFPISYEVVSEETGIRKPGPGETIITSTPMSGNVHIESGENGPVVSADITAPEDIPQAVEYGLLRSGDSRRGKDGRWRKARGNGRTLPHLDGTTVCFVDEDDSDRSGDWQSVSSVDPASFKLEQVVDAAKQRKMAYIEYQRKDGTFKGYVIEPYSFRSKGSRTYLFGHDIHDNRTKSFVVDRVVTAQVLDAMDFVPRWIVELDKLETVA